MGAAAGSHMAAVLIVDDDQLTRTLVASVLEAAGHAVITRDDGEAVRALLEEQPVDVVVLDVVMPGKSGIEVLRELREHQATANTQVLLLTSLGRGEDRVRGLKLGANDYLVKPFEPEELVIRVERLAARAPKSESSALPRIARMVRAGGIEEGAILGRYVVEELVGEGAMGLVFRGRDPKLRRKVALKTVHLARELPPDQARRMVTELLREAVTAARLNHPHVVAVYDVEDLPEAAFIAMEYVDGITLDDYVWERGRLAGDEVAMIGLAVARALEAAHAQGLVHHDVKPGNVLLGRNGEIKVTDFGLSRAITTVTKSDGHVWGTPGYLPPETLLGRGYDGQGDLFGLGATLYYCLTGARAFWGDDLDETLDQTLHREPAPPRSIHPDVTEPMDRLVLDLLAKDPAHRLRSAGDAVRRLESLALGAGHGWRPELSGAAAGATRSRPESRMVLTDGRAERDGEDRDRPR